MSSALAEVVPAPRRGGGARLLKRALDLACAIAALLVVCPVFPLAALAIKLNSPGPVFFSAKRVGARGKPFVMYKFRSMYSDAEERLRELQALNRGGNLLIRIPDDPRVTRVGRLLRKTSVDELPQLFNVLKGDMSMVGPRPQYPNEVAHYTDQQRRRLAVLPGITGLWQVHARESADFAEWVRYDLEYVDHWSFWLDLWILLVTIPSMLGWRPKNASSALASRRVRDRLFPVK